MKHLHYQLIVMLLLTINLYPAYAGGSLEHSSQALEMSLQAIGHSTIAGLKLVSGAAAVPLVSVGEIGKVSGEIGNELWEEANTPIADAFPVSDEVVTVGPDPKQQLENSND